MAKPARCQPERIKTDFRTFFVTARTAEGKALLQTDRMADLFIEVLRSYVREGAFRVHDFVVMRNHVHLLLTIGPEMTIEKAVQLVKGNFAFRARKEFGIRDWIWQRGFSDVEIRDEASFHGHQKHIYDNPVKAGMACVAEEYPHGSLYLRKLKSQRMEARVSPTEVGSEIRKGSLDGTAEAVP
jgi:putative transposase